MQVRRYFSSAYFKFILLDGVHFFASCDSISYSQINLTNIPANLVYGEHYSLAIFAIPSRCNRELCSSIRVRLPAVEHLPCQSSMPFTMWFDGAGSKNLVNNMTLYALDDLLFKIEIQINYGLFVAYEPLFVDTATVIIKSPRSAVSHIGLSSYPTRPLTPYVSFEQKEVPMHFIFCAVILATDPWSPPNNLPPQFSSYQTGRGLLIYNVSSQSNTPPIINTQSTSGISFYSTPNPNPSQVKEMTDAYAETFQGVVYDPVNGYSYSMTSALLPYLPYFSNCYNFDNYISIWMLLEGDDCALPDDYDASWYRYKYPALPDQDDVRNSKFISLQ